MADSPHEIPPPLAAGWALLAFVEGDEFVIDTPLNQIVFGTFLRSHDTFNAICILLGEGLPGPAAMLSRHTVRGRARCPLARF